MVGFHRGYPLHISLLIHFDSHTLPVYIRTDTVTWPNVCYNLRPPFTLLRARESPISIPLASRLSSLPLLLFLQSLCIFLKWYLLAPPP